MVRPNRLPGAARAAADAEQTAIGAANAANRSSRIAALAAAQTASAAADRRRAATRVQCSDRRWQDKNQAQHASNMAQLPALQQTWPLSPAGPPHQYKAKRHWQPLMLWLRPRAQSLNADLAADAADEAAGHAAAAGASSVEAKAAAAETRRHAAEANRAANAAETLARQKSATARHPRPATPLTPAAEHRQQRRRRGRGSGSTCRRSQATPQRGHRSRPAPAKSCSRRATARGSHPHERP